MDSDIKTRVTPLEELQTPPEEGTDCLVIIYSSDARQFGRRTLLVGDGPISLGRGSENTLVLENDSVSRRHARIDRRGRHWYVSDLESTNGTYVNDNPITDYQLRKGDQVKVGDTIFKFLSGSDVEAQYHETIYRMTIIDGLTGVHNKRYFLEALDREISRARRHDRALSLLMFDIDHFKGINDNYGHLAGDFVLKELATVVQSRLRPDDTLCRYGGEEFVIVLPETSLEGSVIIAEELRVRVEQHTFTFESETIPVTISVGAKMLDDDAGPMDLIRQADENLYAAKRGGRNRVVGQ